MDTTSKTISSERIEYDRHTPTGSVVSSTRTVWRPDIGESFDALKKETKEAINFAMEEIERLTKKVYDLEKKIDSLEKGKRIENLQEKYIDGIFDLS